MDVLASILIPTLGKKVFTDLLKFLEGNKTDQQKHFEKALAATVAWYEEKYGNTYGARNERFFDYVKTQDELTKLLLVQPEPDPDLIAAIELKDGRKAPVSVVEEFIVKFCEQLELIPDCEAVLAEREKLRNIKGVKSDTAEIRQLLRRIANAVENNNTPTDSPFTPDETPIDSGNLERMFRDEYHLDSLDDGHLGTESKLEQKLDLQQVYIKLDVKDRFFETLKRTANVDELSPQQQKNLPLLFQRFDDRLHLEREKNPHAFQRKEKDDSETLARVAKKILSECQANSLRNDRVICNEMCRDFHIDEQEVYHMLWLLSGGVMVPRPLADIPQKENAFLLIGDAGGGKSTACRYMALQCFAQLRDPKSDILKREFGIKDETPLPVYLRLEDYSAMLDNGFDDRRCLLECAARFWQHDGEPVFSAAQLAFALEHRPVWLFLDGLDEITRPEYRRRLVDVVCRLCHPLPNPRLRILLTSRPAAINDELLNALELPHYRLLNLEPEHIKVFAHRYFAANLPGENKAQIDKRANGLLTALQEVPAAKKLATNPLLLTVVAVLHYKEDTLPHHRSELYEKCMEQLMAQRAKSRGKLSSGGRVVFTYPQDAPNPSLFWNHSEIIDVLRDLAYYAFMRPEDQVLLNRELLLQRLQASENVPPGMKKSHKLEEAAHDFLELCDRCIGVLAFRGGHYVFVHRTFHEYLAAHWLSLQTDAEKESHLQDMLKNPGHWHEVIRLFFNRLGKFNPNFGKQQVERITRSAVRHQDANLVQLAAQCLNDIEEQKPLYTLHETIKQHLQECRDGAHSHPRLFLACGDALGSINEPEIDAAHPPMVKIAPYKPFTMGGDEYERERPVHDVHLSPFWMSRYPVTNRQFAAFMEDGGYRDVRYWSDKGGRFGFDATDFLDGLKEKQPGFWLDDRFGRTRPLAPVVGISWYEAMAYCRWWSLTVGALDFSQGKVRGIMRLPTEAEWECACRAGTQTPFHTGENLTTEQANYNGNYPYKDFPKGVYLQQTTTVGSYAPNSWGLYDMSGNVWQWCLDWFDEDFYKECVKQGIVENPLCTKSGSSRVLRGGSWIINAQFCRSAYRYGFVPGYRYDYVGFRLVFVPQS